MFDDVSMRGRVAIEIVSCSGYASEMLLRMGTQDRFVRNGRRLCRYDIDLLLTAKSLQRPANASRAFGMPGRKVAGASFICDHLHGGTVAHHAREGKFFSILFFPSVAYTTNIIRLTTAITNMAGQGPVSSVAFLTVLKDTDHDGLPDVWEAAHGFDTNNVADGLRDDDGEG